MRQLSGAARGRGSGRLPCSCGCGAVFAELDCESHQLGQEAAEAVVEGSVGADEPGADKQHVARHDRAKLKKQNKKQKNSRPTLRFKFRGY